jgi:CDP-diacylglycerol--serine O-phosphatidyltransferase
MRRFGRPQGSEKPKRLVLSVRPLPTLVTLGNLMCGFGAIVLAMRWDNPPTNFHSFDGNDCLHCAGLLIFAAMIFDVMDGTIARWTKSASKFGTEIDSLADVVSFGVAPAVLIKAMIDQELKLQRSYPLLDRYIFPLLAIYVCCTALRLARYNIEAGHRDFFFGMPSPGAAGCVASLAVLIIVSHSHHMPIADGIQEKVNSMIGSPALDDRIEQWRLDAHRPILLAMPFIMLVFGGLMVSRVHYPHVGKRFLRGRKSFMHILLVGLFLVLAIMHHELVLAVSFNGYLIFGLLNELRCRIFPKQKPPEWAETAPAAPATEQPAGKGSGGA